MASCAFLAAFNNVIGAQAWHRRWYAPANACAAAAMLAAARANGLTAGELGLGRGAWRPGRLAATLAATTTAGYLAAAALPVTRPVLNDRRVTTLDGPGLAYQVAFRIPVGTVLWEEIAFRGVLQAALRRVMPEPAAIAVASGVFGVWHIRPTAAALRVNGLVGDRGQAAVRVAAGVAVTAAGGALFSWLRARSGRLAAPVLLHLTMNCAGPVVAWTVARPASQLRAAVDRTLWGSAASPPAVRQVPGGGCRLAVRPADGCLGVRFRDRPGSGPGRPGRGRVTPGAPLWMMPRDRRWSPGRRRASARPAPRRCTRPGGRSPGRAGGARPRPGAPG